MNFINILKFPQFTIRIKRSKTTNKMQANFIITILENKKKDKREKKNCYSNYIK